MKAKAIRINEYGGPEVLQFVDVDVPDPGPGEARIRHTAIGLNFIDTYHRIGLYPAPLPGGLGSEAAGIVEAVGPEVSEVEVGDRVVYTGRPADSYSECRNFPAAQLVPIPEGISDDEAAAVLLKGLTAWYLLRRSYPVQKGDKVLLYAAAGGVGLLAGQCGESPGCAGHRRGQYRREGATGACQRLFRHHNGGRRCAGACP
ncbi:MAG: alcohol dehydrogenase catalytic domain-containing protein [Woeseiaceae bacterium]|nr:alcohol dehydrogenase catalytic domain-containing protein [Woeseiaceae bacterium]